VSALQLTWVSCGCELQERVQVGSVTRYQKWFSSQFLSAPGSDSLVPDLVRYICAVYHPSNQILGSKVTPRYHLLGWLYLLWYVCHPVLSTLRQGTHQRMCVYVFSMQPRQQNTKRASAGSACHVLRLLVLQTNGQHHERRAGNPPHGTSLLSLRATDCAHRLTHSYRFDRSNRSKATPW
jgi:hypothetical protein